MDVYLKKIELHGFKSFPEKTVIQFHKGITAIIGPNGCGKSNLVDAILWVLGEQKIKNLRGENSEDLIFNGAASKKPLGMTEVGAFFQKRENELFVARRFFRSGESKYILNEKFCRNRDIQEALYDIGIGEKNYFIFEQGSVEKMVSLKPSERRILIEEAAGIVQYLERKKETANKLIITQQNLDSLEIVLNEKSGRLKDLRNQVQFAQRYRKLKAQKNDCLKALLHMRHAALQKQFEESGASLEILRTHEAALSQEIADIEKKVIQLEQQRWELDRRLKADQQAIFEANNRLLADRKEVEKAQQRGEFARQRLTELEKLKKTGDNDLNDLAGRCQGLEEEKVGLDEQMREEEGRMSGFSAEMNRLRGEIDALRRREEEFKKTLFAAQAEISHNQNEINRLEKSLVRVENEIQNKTNLRAELEKQAESGEIAAEEAEKARLSEEYAAREERCAELAEAHEEAAARAGALEKKVRELNYERDNLKRQKDKYLEIKQKIVGREGGAPFPTRGKLQDWLQADKKYHRLLENFYFDEMDAPVLNDAHQAETVQAGKFLVLRRDNGGLPAEIAQEPGFQGFVRDLFTLETAEKECFRNGVLVDSLKNGVALFVKYGVDVATTAGELITRGGVVIRNRQKGILEVLDEIKEIENRIAEGDRALEEARRQQGEAAAALAAAKSALDREKGLLAGLKEKLIAIQARLESRRKNRELSLNRMRMAAAEIETLQREEAKLQQEWQKLQEKREQAAQRNQQLQQEREGYGEAGARLQEARAELEREKLQRESNRNLIREKLNSKNQTLRDLQQRRQRLQEQLQQAAQETERLQREGEEVRERIAHLKEAIRVGETEKDEVQKRVHRQETELVAIDTEARRHSADLTQRRRGLDEVREKEKNLEITLAGVKKDLFQLEELSFQELGMELKEITVEGEALAQTPAELESSLEEMNSRLNKMRESDRLNFSAESEYEILEKDHGFLLGQKEDVLNSIRDMNEAIQRIDRESRESFLKAFQEVKESFVRNFKILFEGGEAELALTDEENVLECGLEIQAQPPGKKLQNLRLLSGGEKTLTSLAFLFALFQYKPSPFCFFDEVDASLDEANIQRFLKFLHQLKTNTQFVIITHNFKTMEEADYIYGISMDEPGISKVYSIKMT